MGFLIALVSAAFAETGTEIMQKVIEGQRAGSSAMDIEMRLVDKTGKISTRRIQTLVVEQDGLRKTITLFLEPASVRNTRFLTVENATRDDDQWIYLPALRKTKRIAASERGGSFMGSDFSYSDMSFSSESVDKSTHTVLREETVDGRDCYVVESVPKDASGSQYGKEISWVDKATWLTAKVEFYGEDGSTLKKVLTAEEYKRIDDRWIAAKISMSTVDTAHTTILAIKQVKYDIPINPAYFTPRFLESGRTQ